MNPIHQNPPQELLQNNAQIASPGMNQVARLDSQGKSFFRKLPASEAERKLLIHWLINNHNDSCTVSTNKITTVKPSFSSSYPKLATWIENTFSDLSTRGMHLIAFALASFPEYHYLVTSTPSTANTQIIKELFQCYGTELFFKALTDLSYLMKETGEFKFFKCDINKFCSRVTPEAINRAAFEHVSGMYSLNSDVAKYYYASTALFARLYLCESASIGFNSQSILSEFGLSLDQFYSTKKLFPDPFEAIMATIHEFIKSRASQSNLIDELSRHINNWSKYDHCEGIRSFNNAIHVIEEMQVNEAKKASLQPMGLKPKEHTGSFSMAEKTPASPKSQEEVDTYDLC